MSINSVLVNEAFWHVEHGDSLAVLRQMPDACIDLVITDPPAGIHFMGKQWDGSKEGREVWVSWLSTILSECFRVTKPGGRILCWSIPRTSHWTGCAVEDAGWEIENTIAHIFGSGFPKAKTQLKPAREDWWLARKPSKRISPFNIDACRVAPGSVVSGGGNNFDAWRAGEGRTDRPQIHGERSGSHTKGRWPTNLVLTHSIECSVECVGDCPVKELNHPFFNEFYSDPNDHETALFVYQAKASRTDRESGCEGLTPQDATYQFKTAQCCECGSKTKKAGQNEAGPSCGHNNWQYVTQVTGQRGGGKAVNNHPTVKSTPLMRHFVRLLAKPGDLVLDAFCGSGSTGRGAVLEGCRFIGIEREDTEAEPYVTIARRRIADAQNSEVLTDTLSLFGG